MNLIIFDPSKSNNVGALSSNLGDLVIRDKISLVIDELFPSAQITRVATHSFPDKELRTQAENADLCLIAGTNLLSSDILSYNQWKLIDNPLDYADPPRLKAILCGVGWWQYQSAPSFVTGHFYRHVLSVDGPHSLRDAYSLTQLKQCAITGLYNTSCPTLWGVDGYSTSRKGTASKCLFCLTDYAPDSESDNKLIELLAKLYPDGLLFFPQGSHDCSYLHSLDTYKTFQNHITILDHSYDTLNMLQKQHDWDYIGTRLHAGAWSLQQQRNTLILAVDNRATEIGRKTGLPVVERSNHDVIKQWHTGRDLAQPVIRLPQGNIEAWKEAVVLFTARNKDVRTGHNPLLTQHAVIPTASKSLLNLGCGGRRHPAWTNVDFTSITEDVLACDLTKPLPFADASASMVYASHVLEHFSKTQAVRFLAEVYRVLDHGGLIRLVVPDLEWLSKRYLDSLNNAKTILCDSQRQSEETQALAEHEYAVINCIDQLCRHEPGGEMLRFWQSMPPEAVPYVVETNGLEVLRGLIALQYYPPKPEKASSVVEPAPPPSFWERTKIKLGLLAPRPSQLSDACAELGAFRLSGEVHQWMYDEISLGLLLKSAGFSNITRHTAATSAYTGFSAFCLDTGRDSQQLKPESLYMEAEKA